MWIIGFMYIDFNFNSTVNIFYFILFWKIFSGLSGRCRMDRNNFKAIFVTKVKLLFWFDFKLNEGGSFEFWSEKFNFWFGWHKVDFFSKLGWWLGFGWSKIDSWQKVWSHGLKFDLLCFCFSIWDSWSVSSSKISVLQWWLGWFSQNL